VHARTGIYFAIFGADTNTEIYRVVEFQSLTTTLQIHFLQYGARLKPKPL
jgi:S-ribosylhomocysteine lyase LuxS involved in autoinducer biosynthesis